MFDYIVVALLLGSLWGFFEVFFKDVLAMGGRPFTSAIMTGIGVSMMALGYGLFRKARIFILISAFTVLTRMIVVPGQARARVRNWPFCGWKCQVS